jgi:broad specificity phosphatase PhoE
VYARRCLAEDSQCKLQRLSCRIMPIIYMVRHGRITSDPTNPRDPELGPDGHSQARAVAQELSARLPAPLTILTSPLRRCQETAAPLSQLWRAQPAIEPRVAEVPSPERPGFNREEWLRQTLASSWPELTQLAKPPQDGHGAILALWRKGVQEAVLACRDDTVIVSHFVPINVLVGRALRTPRVTCFRPDYTSVTILETVGDDIRLIECGREGGTRIV